MAGRGIRGPAYPELFSEEFDTDIHVFSKDLKLAQEKILAINNDKLTNFITNFNDLPEFISDTEDSSKKTELGNKIDSFLIKLTDDVEKARASEEFKAYLEFSNKFKVYCQESPTAGSRNSLYTAKYFTYKNC